MENRTLIIQVNLFDSCPLLEIDSDQSILHTNCEYFCLLFNPDVITFYRDAMLKILKQSTMKNNAVGS